jgi:hypothetical protein
MTYEELIPAIGVEMVSILYGYNTNLIKTDYEFTIN